MDDPDRREVSVVHGRQSYICEILEQDDEFTLFVRLDPSGYVARHAFGSTYDPSRISYKIGRTFCKKTGISVFGSDGKVCYARSVRNPSDEELSAAVQKLVEDAVRIAPEVDQMALELLEEAEERVADIMNKYKPDSKP